MSPCPGCGEPVAVPPYPADLPAWLREWGARMSQTVWHDACHAAHEQQSERSRQEAALREREAASRMPLALRRRVRGFRFAAALETLADEWAAGHGMRLLLTGRCGAGKTSLAAVAALRWLERGGRLRWVSAPEMMAHLGTSFGSAGREDALALLYGRGCLVIDDIDKVRPTEHGAEQVFLAVDQRVVAGSSLLLTANLGAEGIASRWPEPYAAALASRLAGECRLVRLQGADRRLGQASTP